MQWKCFRFVYFIAVLFIIKFLPKWWAHICCISWTGLKYLIIPHSAYSVGVVFVGPTLSGSIRCIHVACSMGRGKRSLSLLWRYTRQHWQLGNRTFANRDLYGSLGKVNFFVLDFLYKIVRHLIFLLCVSYCTFRLKMMVFITLLNAYYMKIYSLILHVMNTQLCST